LKNKIDMALLCFLGAGFGILWLATQVLPIVSNSWQKQTNGCF